MKIIFTKFRQEINKQFAENFFPGKIVLIDKAEDTEAAVKYPLEPAYSGCGYGDSTFVQQG